MKEYYKRPDATAEFFWKDAVGNEWGCTGDVGYVDEDGFVFVQGRASDFFVNKLGEHVYCFDVEDEILKLLQVYQCEVIGVHTEDGYLIYKDTLKCLCSVMEEKWQWILVLIIIVIIQIVIFVRFWNSRDGELNLIATAEVIKDNAEIIKMKAKKNAELKN